MAKTDEKAKLKELKSEVWFSQKDLRHFSEENLIYAVLEIQEDLKELHRAKQQSDEAFETVDRLKHDNIMLNVELSLIKLCLDAPNSEVLPLAQYPNFEKLKSDLEDLRSDKVLVRGNNTWYLDSGCSRHMTRDKSRFLSLDAYYGGTVTFGDNMKGDIVSIGKVGRSSSHAIDNVFLVEGLKHNLLSISQFCDKGNSVSFTSNKCRIIHNDTGNIILEGTHKGNTYDVDLNEVPYNSLTCLSVIEDDPLLWHKRFGHASFTLLDKLKSKELVEELPCIKFLYDKDCDDDFEIGLVPKQDPDEESTSLKKQQVENVEETNPEANGESEMENAQGTPPQEQNQDQVEEYPVEVPTKTQDQVPTEEPVNNNQERLYPVKDFTPKRWKYKKSHPVDTIMSDITKGTQTRS
ncbi:uncharacterized protein LOC110700103 [Chenopodium quinoa]|uniref:uncharacterized protein LOC110700103 n=1 Tax=Chenopodium quinoa TaxID=63459 RepID=UPI000B79517F|nr:uncharacterized protein LOC110700103 [Chenopodium quinoa]